MRELGEGATGRRGQRWFTAQFDEEEKILLVVCMHVIERWKQM